MPIYEITDQQSYSHPMHDYGFGADDPAVVPSTATDVLLTTPKAEAAEATDWMAYLSPIIAGGVMAIFAYGISRKFNVDKGKARGIAVTIGGLTALGHGLSNWMFKQTEPIRAVLPTTDAASIVPVVTAPATALPAASIPAGSDDAMQIPASTDLGW